MNNSGEAAELEFGFIHKGRYIGVNLPVPFR